MSNFVLVHGAWQSAWSWERVIGEMEAARGSHDVGQVLAPDLPGHGRRYADDVRRVTMEHYVHAVATLVQVERLEDVVLVGHGFSGTFLPRVAVELGDRVKRVVFLAGQLPPEGESVYDRLSLWNKLMLRAFKAGEKGFRFPDSIFKGILCNGLDATSCRDLLSRVVPESLLPWRTPVFRQGFAGRFKTTYVILARDKAIRPRLQRRYSQSLGSLQIEELTAGHAAPLSHPREVARLLLEYE